MKLFKHCFKSFLHPLKHCQRGFTLQELLMGMVVTGIILATSSQVLIHESQLVSLVTNRKAVYSDIKVAIKRIKYDLVRLETSDILSIADDSISFLDKSGSAVTYALNSQNEVTLNGDVLFDQIESFDILYYRSSGNQVSADPANIPNVHRIRFTIKTLDINDKAPIRITTYVTPRAMLGYNVSW